MTSRRRRNWRFLLVAAAFVAVIEVVFGIAAYGSKTWNLTRTEVLTGWPAVREVCLVMVPLFGTAVVLGAWALAAAVMWASRGDR